MRKKICIAIAGIICLCAVFIRIAYLNRIAEPQFYERINPEIWVSLEGNHIYDCETEQTDGYWVKAHSTQIMCVEDFFDRYQASYTSFVESSGYVLPKDSIVVVACVELRNENSTQGKIRLADWTLLNSSYSFGTTPDVLLLQVSTPAIAVTQNPNVSLNPGSTYMLDIPFVMERGTSSITAEKVYDEGPYTIVPCCYPTRKELRLAEG